ncbi:hypothetical protein GCM10010470_01530 [Saccharopolyspora taberi]|uniref:Uncharacterized protein n=1 Tax=Saccharopolyspora taberi TaxID=60895 RepID=A0ABN3V083_9PSEU
MGYMLRISGVSRSMCGPVRPGWDLIDYATPSANPWDYGADPYDDHWFGRWTEWPAW